MSFIKNSGCVFRWVSAETEQRQLVSRIRSELSQENRDTTAHSSSVEVEEE
jgi:hypothetical protein